VEWEGKSDETKRKTERKEGDREEKREGKEVK
jgi:hypothetical protein